MTVYLVTISKEFAGDRRNIEGVIKEIKPRSPKNLKIIKLFFNKKGSVDFGKISNIKRSSRVVVLAAERTGLNEFEKIFRIVAKKTDNIRFILTSHRIFVENPNDYKIFQKGDVVFTQISDYRDKRKNKIEKQIIKLLKGNKVKIILNKGVGHDLDQKAINSATKKFLKYSKTKLRLNKLGLERLKTRPAVLLVVGGDSSNGKITNKQLDDLFKYVPKNFRDNLLIVTSARTPFKKLEYIKKKVNKLKNSDTFFFPFCKFDKKGYKQKCKYSANGKTFNPYQAIIGLIQKNKGFCATFCDSTSMLSEMFCFVGGNLKFVKNKNASDCNLNLVEEYISSLSNKKLNKKFVDEVKGINNKQGKILLKLLKNQVIT